MAGINYKSLSGVTANGDLNSAKYKCGYINGDNKVGFATNATEVDGVFQHDAKSGQPVDFAVEGVTYAIAGAAVTVGSMLKVDSSYRVIGTTTRTDTRIGVALTAASAAGDQIEILIKKN